MLQTNRGVVLDVGTGVAGTLTMPNAGVSILAPYRPTVGASERIVLTCVFGFGGSGITSYDLRVDLLNNNRFGSLTDGYRRPSAGSSGTSVAAGTAGLNPSLNSSTPILSVAQRDNNAGFLQITHNWTSASGVVRDLVLITGGLIGPLLVVLTPQGSGAPTGGDSFMVAMDAG